MPRKLKHDVDTGKHKKTSDFQDKSQRNQMVQSFIEKFSLPREGDELVDIPVALIDSKLRTTSGEVVDNYRGRSMSHNYLNSSGFIALKNDIYRKGVRVPILVKIADTEDQIIVQDGRNRLTALRTLQIEAKQLGNNEDVKRFGTIPCIVSRITYDRFADNSSDELLEDAFLINHHRRSDSFYAEAVAVRQLQIKGHGKDEILDLLGKSRTWLRERYNLASCLGDSEYGPLISELIESDDQGERKLTKKNLSSIFARKYSEGQAKFAYEQIQAALKKNNSDSGRRSIKGATKSVSKQRFLSAYNQLRNEIEVTSEIEQALGILQNYLFDETSIK